jgi:hypothetical protein
VTKLEPSVCGSKTNIIIRACRLSTSAQFQTYIRQDTIFIAALKICTGINVKCQTRKKIKVLDRNKSAWAVHAHTRTRISNSNMILSCGEKNIIRLKRIIPWIVKALLKGR